MPEELKLLESYEGPSDAKYIYEYKGYIIKNELYADDDCTHESAEVYLKNNELAHFNWRGCLKKAIEFIESELKAL